jgi:hypothetical protein
MFRLRSSAIINPVCSLLRITMPRKRQGPSSPAVPAKRAKAKASPLSKQLASGSALRDIEDLVAPSINSLTSWQQFMTDASRHHHAFAPDDRIAIRKQLIAWFDQHQRELPWRQRWCSSNTTQQAPPQQLSLRAYQVWISEIMLQQTRVSTVIDYYNRWMARFPTIYDLAAASLDVCTDDT